jgi:hypothetical protein
MVHDAPTVFRWVRWIGVFAVCAGIGLAVALPTPATEQWVRYIHPSLGFRIAYPAGWQLLPDNGSGTSFTVAGPSPAGIEDFKMNLVVVGRPIPAGATLDAASAALEQALARRFGQSQVLRTDRVTLDGTPALLTYVYRKPSKGPQLYQIVLLTISGEMGYAAAGTTAARSAKVGEETLTLQRSLMTFRPR